jgi:hypothetical protein
METPNKHETLEKRVLDKIETGEVTQKPRSYFIVKNVLMWSLAACAVVLGALAVSGIIFRLHNIPLLLPMGADMPGPRTIVLLVPFLWIGLLGLFAYFAYREVRATDKGYRYKLSTIILLLIVISGALGFVLYGVGSGRTLDKMASHHVPFHRDLDEFQDRVWLMPEHGFLVGSIESISGDVLTVMTRDNTVWTVLLGDTIDDALLRLATEGGKIGIHGNLLDAEARVFRACDMRRVELHGRGIFMPALPRPREETKEAEGVMEHMMRGRGIERNASTTRTTLCGARTASETVTQ